MDECPCYGRWRFLCFAHLRLARQLPFAIDMSQSTKLAPTSDVLIITNSSVITGSSVRGDEPTLEFRIDELEDDCWKLEAHVQPDRIDSRFRR
jgi:hypothetical protein